MESTVAESSPPLSRQIAFGRLSMPQLYANHRWQTSENMTTMRPRVAPPRNVCDPARRAYTRRFPRLTRRTGDGVFSGNETGRRLAMGASVVRQVVAGSV